MTNLLWREIDTAPKDGTWILVYGEGTDDEDKKRKIAVAQYAHTPICHENERRWQFAWYDGGYFGEFLNPTHWMPLPSEPH
jgi:hypothetical protein